MKTPSKKKDLIRWTLYVLWIAASLVLFAEPLGLIIGFALNNHEASYILLIPGISLWVIYLERRAVFHRVSYGFPVAALFLVAASLFYLGTMWAGVSRGTTNYLAECMMILILLWISGFALFFGRTALHASRFSFSFLLLAVPLPDILLNHTIYFLQKGSTEVVGALFDLIGVPYLREGFVFHLAQVNIEVAKECSGIRSSMALLILALLVGHFYLRNFWRKLVFVLCGILIMIIKNGVRIATLTLLAIYVNPEFLFGRLHHQGGVVFFLFGLLLLVPVLWLLRRGEMPREGNSNLLTTETSSKAPSA